MNTKEAKEGLIYLYCITDKVPKLKEIENLVDKPYFIYHKSLYAIVNKVKESEFDEENLKRNLADLEWIKEKANIHEKAIEGVMKNTCVIPFKFATLFNTEDNLKAMLVAHLEEFKDILIKLEDKEEWGVKIYCNSGKLKESLMQEDEQLLNIDKEINGSTTLTIDPERSRRVNSPGPGKSYLLKKKKEELLNIAVNKKFNEYGQISFDRLRERSQEAGINKLLPKEVTERNDEMILNSAFLINKDKVEDFLNIVEDLRARYTDK
ncbi:MAG: GvpL/GvpF family gas vesicle protein, partial [Candidatus Omnitrophota bacterium]|nr:GvpL/GvpF family gas vesicle protein [Candidatus Omnitrophota bacterium]